MERIDSTGGRHEPDGGPGNRRSFNNLCAGCCNALPRVNLSDSPVALHDGSCTDPVLEPEFEIGTLELEARYASAYGLTEDFEPGELAEGDVNANGVFDAYEGAYLAEDLDDDGVLDEGEDLNGNGVLDVGFDGDDDGVPDDDEIVTAANPHIPAGEFASVWKVDEEVDASFEEIFGTPDDSEEEDEENLSRPGVLAVHKGPESYGTILACAELAAPAGWEDRDTVVLGVTPAGDSDLFGYAVFERDTGNVPVFGENTTAVTVYIIDSFPTLRDARAEGTPTPAATPQS